jgi:hypothetical protein
MRLIPEVDFRGCLKLNETCLRWLISIEVAEMSLKWLRWAVCGLIKFEVRSKLQKPATCSEFCYKIQLPINISTYRSKVR